MKSIPHWGLHLIFIIYFAGAIVAGPRSYAGDLNCITTEIKKSVSPDFSFLTGIGFDPEIANKVLKESPSFVTLYKKFLERHPDLTISEANALPEVPHIYRSLILKTESDFDPNWGVFNHLDEASFAGYMNVTTSRASNDDYGYGNFIVEFQVPKNLLIPGKSESAYSISADDLHSLGIHNLSAFVVKSGMKTLPTQKPDSN